jgi:hypothetical protein
MRGVRPLIETHRRCMSARQSWINQYVFKMKSLTTLPREGKPLPLNPCRLRHPMSFKPQQVAPTKPHCKRRCVQSYPTFIPVIAGQLQPTRRDSLVDFASLQDVTPLLLVRSRNAQDRYMPWFCM